jgi:hypothetical protein
LRIFELDNEELVDEGLMGCALCSLLAALSSTFGRQAHLIAVGILRSFWLLAFGFWFLVFVYFLAEYPIPHSLVAFVYLLLPAKNLFSDEKIIKSAL